MFVALLAATALATPADRQLAAFIAAFNSGSRPTFRRFVEAQFEKPQGQPGFVDSFVDSQMGDFKKTGGYIVRKKRETGSAAVHALVQAKLTGAWCELGVFISAQPPEFTEAAAPYKIVGLGNQGRRAPSEFVERKKLSDRELRVRIGKMLSALVAHDSFSGCVLVARHGKPVYSGCYGMASRVWHAKNDLQTRFNLASITKMFTGVAVCQLVEAGKLSLDETVGQVLPDYPNATVKSEVTIRHLLSHTSGLIGARALVEKSKGGPPLTRIADMVQGFSVEPLSFPPGQQFDYSNAGFTLLGRIIEKASGHSYYDYVLNHVFRPAGMASTGFLELDKEPERLATGYEDSAYGERRSNIFDLSPRGGPAGGAFSTAPDMAKFAEALTKGKLVSRKMLNLMWTGVTEEPSRASEYGLAAQIIDVYGNRMIWHGGGWKGVTDEFDVFPELGYSVVVLSNIDDDPGTIAAQIQEWITQGPHIAPDPGSGAPKVSLTVHGPTSAAVGQAVEFAVVARNDGDVAHASIIDLEFKDAAGNKQFQRFVMGQKLSKGATKTYRFMWTPDHAGEYRVDLGAFGPGWRQKLAYYEHAATVTIK
jgi:CubicO group peptidase (beta-lactamase class C family)